MSLWWWDCFESRSTIFNGDDSDDAARWAQILSFGRRLRLNLETLWNHFILCFFYFCLKSPWKNIKQTAAEHENSCLAFVFFHEGFKLSNLHFRQGVGFVSWFSLQWSDGPIALLWLGYSYMYVLQAHSFD